MRAFRKVYGTETRKNMKLVRESTLFSMKTAATRHKVDETACSNQKLVRFSNEIDQLTGGSIKCLESGGTLLAAL
jgi:hypothetical protein